MHQRGAAAREAARARGRHTGRPPRLTEAQARQVRALRTAGESVAELVRSFGVSQATIYCAPFLDALSRDAVPGPTQSTRRVCCEWGSGPYGAVSCA